MREEIYVPGSGTVNDITFKGGGVRIQRLVGLDSAKL